MKISTVKTLWGVTQEQGNAPGEYERLFTSIKASGFTAVETCIWKIEDPVDFCAALTATGLKYVAMINTCKPPNDPHVGSRSLQDHIASFTEQVARVQSAIPAHLLLLINAHSGCDSWPLETTTAFFTAALAIEADARVLICHETHRGRALYNPWVTRDVCRLFGQLHLTADLSHFAVVAERLFADDDADWNECLAEITRATRHIHARVGYPQGPQVNDPRAPEHAAAVAAHQVWWDAIVARQSADGAETLTIEPEHGVDGYQQCLPHTQEPVADVKEVNQWIRDRLVARYTSQGFVIA